MTVNIKQLEWRVWHDGLHSKCGRFLILPEGNMFRLTHGVADVKANRVVTKGTNYMTLEIAKEQAEAMHLAEIKSWLTE